MRNSYFLCFTDPVPADEINEVFLCAELPVAVKQVMPNAFALSSDESPSRMRFILQNWYGGEIEENVPARTFTFAVVRTGTELLTYRGFGSPPG